MEADPGRADLGTLGMVKSGRSPDDPFIQSVIEKRLLPKFKNGEYRPSNEMFGVYETGVDLMLLVDTHPERYQQQIDTLVKMLVELQEPEGWWDYPKSIPYRGEGDTSMSQYALMGLWDAARAGTAVPYTVWDRAAGWLISKQEADGGFWYHPGNATIKPSDSTTAAGTSNLLICRLMLYGQIRPERLEKRQYTGGKYGVLRSVDLDVASAGAGKVAKPTGPVKMARTAIDSSARRALLWIDHFWDGPKAFRFRYYYFYALERACSIARTDRVGDHNWYNEVSNMLLKEQHEDGSWNDADVAGAVANTAFAVMFLARATGRIVGDAPSAMFGSGLMIGGRGLPQNLDAVQSSPDGIKVKKADAPVDSLLAELENPKSTQIEEVQQAIVESVEVGDREKLVGQTERLKRLARDPRVEVRRTVLWALGRCATIRDAAVIVRGLDDPDISVAVEANNALCWLSRKPNGFGSPADPLVDVPENATDRQKQEAIRKWRTQVRSEWRTWFNRIRPYSERDLPIDLP